MPTPIIPRHMSNEYGSYTDDDLEEMYLDQGGHCGYCGIGLCGETYVDAMIPFLRGGSNNPDNLLLVCHDCYISKGHQTPQEWEAVRGW